MFDTRQTPLFAECFFFPSVFKIALGKEFVCRVPERIHSANIKTLSKFDISGSGCDQGPKGPGLKGNEGNLYLHRSSGPPLEDEAPPLMGVPRPDGPYNRVEGHHP